MLLWIILSKINGYEMYRSKIIICSLHQSSIYDNKKPYLPGVPWFFLKSLTLKQTSAIPNLDDDYDNDAINITKITKTKQLVLIVYRPLKYLRMSNMGLK